MATLTETNGRQTLTIQRRFMHSAEKLWSYVVHPQKLSQWYPAQIVEFEPAVGTDIRFDYGDDFTSTGRVTELAPGTRLAFTETSPEEMSRESDNSITIEVQPDDGGSLLTFIHEFDDRPAAAAYADGWDTCLEVLGDLLDGLPAREASPSIERYEDYVKEFGLDRPTIGHDTLRVERQLMLQSPEKVWRVLHPTTLEQLAPGRLGPGQISGRVDGEWVEIELANGGSLRWEVQTGPGGARIVLTHTGIGNQVDDLRIRWHDHIERLVQKVIAAPDEESGDTAATS
ncbi:SRPBCC domain-containing protein [Salinibacterium sp. ZJ450]|uniref:SRPBCC domain-containing protein n=1 Tax=Salinibacterium sp. ZJ450 TaxID=2708338 RepID=UPI00141E0D18|nr:SRPBCC domain-containing protein [Salinibacterium sp. ZJ450]